MLLEQRSTCLMISLTQSNGGGATLLLR